MDMGGYEAPAMPEMPAATEIPQPETIPTVQATEPTAYGMPADFGYQPAPAGMPEMPIPSASAAGAAKPVAAGVTTPGGKELGIGDRISQALGIDKGTLGTLGRVGVTGLMGALAGRRGAKQAQAAAEAQQQMATPYQARGRELQTTASRGELTAPAQQQLQAASAQLQQIGRAHV